MTDQRDPRSAIILTWSLAGRSPMLRHIVDLASGLAARDIDVTVMAPSVNPPTRATRTELRAAGVRLDVGTPTARAHVVVREVWQRTRIAVTQRRGTGIRKAPIHAALNIMQMLTARLANGLPDVIDIHSWRLGLAGIATMPEIAGIPVVLTEHAPPEMWSGGVVREQDRSAARHLGSLAATLSSTAAFLERHVGVPVHLAPTIAALRGLQPHRSVARPAGGSLPARVVAMVNAQNDHAWVHDAVARGPRSEPGWEVAVVDTSRRHAPDDAILTLGDADIVCVHRNHPAAAFIAAYAAESGIPLVTGGPIPGLSVIDRGSVLVADPANAAGLAETLDELAGDPLLAQALALAAQRHPGRTPAAQHALAARAIGFYMNARSATALQAS